MSAIKNVGGAAIDSILSARKNGQFTSLENFCSRVNLTAVNKKTLESLIKAGAMDSFGNRASLLIMLPEIVNKAHKLKKQEAEGQSSLFGDNLNDEDDTTIIAYNMNDFTEEEKLSFEKEFLGFYLTSHPHMEVFSAIQSIVTHDLDVLKEEEEGTSVRVGGIIEAHRRVFTKKSNSEMAFITIGNEKGNTIECIVFPKTFEEYKSLLITDSVVVIEGKLDTKNDKPMVISQKIYTAKNFRA